MTTYAEDEASTEAGEPVELYEFTSPATVWRYTSGIETVTYDGDDFDPLAGLTRSAIAMGSVRDMPSLTVDLPTSAAVVARYAFAIPDRELTLRVIRVQTGGEARVLWVGDVISMNAAGVRAQAVASLALSERLRVEVPALMIQRHCNHVLYDSRCRVARASFDLATTIAAVSSDGRTVTVAGVGGNPDQWFKAGEIVRDSDGERRLIVDQVGGVLKIASPFRELANPNAVTLYAGCDHIADTCDTKFANKYNFGGHAFVPRSNAHRQPIRLLTE